MNLLQASITSSVLILVIVAVRALTKYRLPKTMFLVLWAVAMIKLVLPCSVTSVFSIYNIVVLPGMNSVFTLKSFTSTSAGDIITLISILATGAGSTLSADPLFAVWAFGAAVSCLFFFYSLVGCQKIINEALPIADGGKLAACVEGQGLRRTIRVLTSDRLITPIAVGIFRPKIILPKFMDFNDEAQMTYVLTHELVHIRRFHTLWKFFLIAVLCLHWFNPIVWLMYRLANNDLENSCDEQVLKRLGSGSRTGYALSLLGMAQLQSGFAPILRDSMDSVAVNPVASGFLKNAAEQRIKMVMLFRKTSRLTVLVSAFIIAFVTLVFATMSNSKFERTLSIGVDSESKKIFSGAVYLGTPHHPYYYSDDLPTLYGVFQTPANAPASFASIN